MTKEETLYRSIGEQMKEVQQSKMYGKPCFKVDGKTFIYFFQNEMVFKLAGDAHREALSLEGSKLFDPSGKNRHMKEWIQVPADHSGKWTKFAEEAFKYVRGSER